MSERRLLRTSNLELSAREFPEFPTKIYIGMSSLYSKQSSRVQVCDFNCHCTLLSAYHIHRTMLEKSWEATLEATTATTRAQIFPSCGRIPCYGTIIYVMVHNLCYGP